MSLKNDSNPSPTSRRNFLRNSSVLLAGATIANGVIARSAHAAGSDTIKIGLVGCGGRGTGATVQAMNTSGGEVKLTAMADVFPDRLQASYRSIKSAHNDKVDVPADKQFVGFDSYTNLLKSDVDMVILATPPGFRPLHFAAAVAAGKHVFMEKPVAVDPAGVRKVLEATAEAKKKSLAVAVGLQRRHERKYMATIKALQDGAIGDFILARAYWNGSRPWLKERQKEWTETEYQMRNWYYFNWLCGDHICEQHIHNLDVINWLMNDYPTMAQGQGGRVTTSEATVGEIFDHHMIEYTYGAGLTMLSQCRHQRGCWNAVSEAVHGSKGHCDISGSKIYDENGKLLHDFGKLGADGHQQEHHDLFADLRAGKLPNEGEWGAKSSMTAILGRMATYSGKQIKWDDALASDLVISPVDKIVAFGSDSPVKPNADGIYDLPVPGKTKVL